MKLLLGIAWIAAGVLVAVSCESPNYEPIPQPIQRIDTNLTTIEIPLIEYRHLSSNEEFSHE